jgi:TRAP transporter TAXI family solute receptor
MTSRFRNLLFFIRIQWPLILAVALVLFGFYITFQFVEEPPPKQLTLAGGAKGGGYDYFAGKYAEALAKNGVKVKILETKGSLENLQLLQDPNSGVDVAFTQGGVGWMSGAYSYSPEESSIRSIAKIYEEPLWIFTRKNAGFTALRDLKGKRLSVGPRGSGANALGVDLLKWNAISPENTTFLELSQEEALTALNESRVDAVFFVGGTGSPFLKRCATNPSLLLHSFDDAPAYIRRFPYLSAVTLPRSVLDLGLNIPPLDVILLAPSATLASRQDLHGALVYLLLDTAKQLHSGHSILSNAGTFPSGLNLEFPLHKEASRYFQSGPPLLQRYLPYHIAAFIDRTKILLLPLLTLLLPLFKIAYPTYRWSIRRKIWKWYKSVSVIESDHYRGQSDKAELLTRIQELEKQVAKVQVPFSYASELYTLRQHIDMVHQMIAAKE